jgi:Protein of unknown function (DUF642)/PEP-CTERM motif
MRASRLPLAFVAILAATSSHANLLVNGSFEAGTFAPQGNQTMTLNPGSTSLSGWQIFNDSIAWIGLGDPWGLDAFAGDRFLDLSDYAAGAPFGGVSQTIATVPGQQYTLSFYLGSSTFWGRPSALIVTAGSSAGTFASPATGTNNDWHLHTLDFAATSASTTISFVGNAGVNYIGLDNATVTAVPEPGQAALLALGLATMALQFCRRRSR